MTFGAVVQLYAPFVGLMALAFWLGVLSARVRQLEKDSDHSLLVELKVKMDTTGADVSDLKQAMQGVQRQLANISMGRVGQVVELPGNKP